MEQDLFTGEYLRDQGMSRAVEHADRVIESWSDKAYKYTVGYIQSHDKFMVEDIRQASRGVISEPPSIRAWGSIIVRAAKKGLVKRIGFQSVKNAKAHCANAAVWQKIS